MDAAEYANLERIERDHWYYSGKREFVLGWIRRLRPGAKDLRALDCGAGTGRFALELARAHDVWVLDDHEESLRLLRERFPAERVLSLSGDRVPLPDGSLDIVTALDVLEHTPDDAAVARGFHRLLVPGGLAVVTVPASMALWSDWDVSLHHFRRYDRAGLRAIFPESSWKIEYINYTNVPAYSAVWLLRRWRRWFPAPAGSPDAERAEDRVPARWLNGLLRRVFVWMAFWRLPMPFGVSLLLVATRR
jgi:SAM-dependent methyltransferase